MAARRREVLRRLVGAYLAGETPDRVAVVVLIVDELLSSAFEDPAGPVELRVQRRVRERSCWIEVCGCARQPATHVSSPARGTDLSLLILNTLCQAWGAAPGNAGYTLWAQASLVPQD